MTDYVLVHAVILGGYPDGEIMELFPPPKEKP
jgi:hypothetical protein